jgi:hypothetical protein
LANGGQIALVHRLLMRSKCDQGKGGLTLLSKILACAKNIRCSAIREIIALFDILAVSGTNA